MNRTLRNEARELLQQGQPATPGHITEAHLLALPEVVQRYLRYSQVIGKEPIRTVRLKQRGKFRQSPRLPWMKLDAEEYYSVNPPGFVWVGTLRTGGFPFVRARDRYRDGKGNMQIKLGTVLTIADPTGAAMDQASMTRYLNEMMWFPTAFLGPNVSFEPVDQTSAKVTLTDVGKHVTATMYFWRGAGNVVYSPHRLWSVWRIQPSSPRQSGLEVTSRRFRVYRRRHNRFRIQCHYPLLNASGELNWLRDEITEIEYN